MLGPNQLPSHGEVSIHEILERVCTLVEAEADPGIRVERDYDPSIPPLWGDADQLIQAVLNVVRNAVQALGRQGVITCALGCNVNTPSVPGAASWWHGWT